ncbi:MAG: 50S ribosomal protein L4 [FCB group bacterium]|nr:50S ribosomal protein L4 [FCB group bacterium]
MKLEVYNQSGEKLSEKVTLEDTVFGITPNKDCVYFAVKSEMAALRQGTSSSKTRGEVSGTGKKPYRQKGTGRSRSGSLRSPSRVHGGAAFGPKPRKYQVKVNKKVRRLARKSVLSQKLADSSLRVIDNLALESSKTKTFLTILNNLKLDNQKVTILTADVSDNLWLSSRNVKNIAVLRAESASTYDLLDCQTLLIDKAGIEALNKQLAN